MKHLFAKALLGVSLFLGLATTSNAVVIWFSFAEIPLPGIAAFPNTDVYVDFETGATSSSTFAGADAHFNLGGLTLSNNTGAATPSWQPIRVASDNSTLANMTVGEIVGPGGPFTSGFADSASHLGNSWTSGVDGYIGYSMEHSTLGTIYGWALAHFDPVGGGVIHKFVWQDNGSPIPAGIPEPTTPLLGLLGLGLLVLRRRRC